MNIYSFLKKYFRKYNYLKLFRTNSLYYLIKSYNKIIKIYLFRNLILKVTV